MEHESVPLRRSQYQASVHLNAIHERLLLAALALGVDDAGSHDRECDSVAVGFLEELGP
jgi:hypothetical protein